MSYSALRNALHEVLKTVQPRIAAILPYEPTQIQTFPTLYTLFNSAERNSEAAGVTVMDYSVIARLCFRWVDNEQAELELEDYVNAIPAAVDANQQLSGAIASGIAKATAITGVYVSIGGTTYRAIDFVFSLKEKLPRSSGI